jgi:Zn-dependent protease/CBS domain-containing protein
MKWSIKIGRIAGIPVYVHATFALLLVWFGAVYWTAGGGLGAVLSGVVFLLALFACVVLHELGHALTARRYGIRTRDIMLLPIGGLARLERMPERPVQELWVALAGPAVNAVIAAVLLFGLLATRSWVPLDSLGVASGSFTERLMVVNVLLAAFNLIPAFPMDGGRVFRALLAMRTDYARATRIAAALGQGAALLFGLIGLLFNPFLLLIALFVWVGAAQEWVAVQTRSALGGVPVEAAMVTDFRTFQPSEPVGRVVETVLAGCQTDFPVLEGERLIGVLTKKRLLDVLAREGRCASVERATEEAVFTVEPKEMLEVALARMQAVGCGVAPVVADGRTLGLLTLDSIAGYLSFRRALVGRSEEGTDPRREFGTVIPEARFGTTRG